MIQKYIYGDPIETDAVIKEIPTSEGHPSYGTISTQDGFSFTYIMQPEDIVYGLGESNRGINKRGFLYVSNCTDEPNHTVEFRRVLFRSPFTAPITLSLLTESITVSVFLLTTRPI